MLCAFQFESFQVQVDCSELRTMERTCVVQSLLQSLVQNVTGLLDIVLTDANANAGSLPTLINDWGAYLASCLVTMALMCSLLLMMSSAVEHTLAAADDCAMLPQRQSSPWRLTRPSPNLSRS